MDGENCYGCREATRLIFRCSSNHLFCRECSEEFDRNCRCGESLLRVRRFPERRNCEKTGHACKYRNRGCTWVFDEKYLSLHYEECKYRPSCCIGAIMKVWNCRWEGSKYQIPEHLKNAHRTVIDVFSFQEENKLFYFDVNKNFHYKIDLIEAFNKTFILYYQFHKQTKLITFIIYLLGTKNDAKKYIYEFEILSDNVNLKIKIKQPCCNDYNIMDLIQKGKCICLPYNMVSNYLKDNNIRIRFRMGRYDN